ncbi:DUF2970 domain-containing protein [Marinobacter sp. SS21]|uniref:DUF2970 domain-containing protein n=1 Tax=Marinobacter sp. SS21 TaxID=2979460 RepID=UPI00232C5C45|nr:DUF2970 domain-containing protein [Marinobacter sp. SS21]MDC0661838.1 DUF2970 domain-containing protein [Marinobacter sp. SS21]
MTNRNEDTAKTAGHRQGTSSPGVLKVMQSILAGAFGVQSNKRREEDFASHSPWPYIAAGVLFTVGFVATLILLVQWVLATS